MCRTVSAGSTAKSAAGALPFSTERAAAVEEMISACQDYSLYAARKLAYGEVFSDDDHETLSLMGTYTQKLLDGVDRIRLELDETQGSIGKTCFCQAHLRFFTERRQQILRARSIILEMRRAYHHP